MGFINIQFRDEDALEMNKCQEEFNKLCELHYPNILGWDHSDLSKRSNIPDMGLWKKFLLNPKVKEWKLTEQSILLDKKVYLLMDQLGTNNSTATVQAMNTLLQQQKAYAEQATNQAIIIYNFVPLTEEEKKNPLINEDKTIPSGIRRAIRYVDDKSSE